MPNVRCNICSNGHNTNLIVGHPVVVEVGTGGESFTTDLTLMGLLSGVDPPVRVERGTGGECFTTHITRMRLLTCEKSK